MDAKNLSEMITSKPVEKGPMTLAQLAALAFPMREVVPQHSANWHRHREDPKTKAKRKAKKHSQKLNRQRG
jgi:hypothetical protein